jgi:late competence protein required for DNA uptake (superfamily II DNA/RNA helicase)
MTKILHIDDNDTIRLLYEEELTKKGYEVKCGEMAMNSSPTRCFATEDELDKEHLKNPTTLYFCGECVSLLQYLGYFLVQEDSPLYDIIPDSA